MLPSLLSALRALPLWLFIGLAASAYAILFVPAFAGVDPTALRQTWGPWVWAWAVAFTTLSVVGGIDRGVQVLKTRAATRRERRSLQLVPLDHQRWWHLAKQQDGSFISQISLNCQVTNLTGRPVQIVKTRIIRPKSKAQSFVTLPIQGSPYHSPTHPVLGHDTVEASVNVMAHRLLGRQGKPIRVTLGLTDQFGEEYRLKNLIIETHDAPPPPLSLADRAYHLRKSFACLFGSKKHEAAVSSKMPWTYEPGPGYLETAEAILAEEKRSYAARGRREGKLGSLNVGLQSEPNLGWTKAGEIPVLLWKEGEDTPLESPNLGRLLKLRSSLAVEEGDNLERFLLSQLQTDSRYAEVAYFIVLALHRMNRTVDALTTARLCLVDDKVYGYSNVLGMLSALVSHEHHQISAELFQSILDSLTPGVEKEFRLLEKINAARVQRLD